MLKRGLLVLVFLIAIPVAFGQVSCFDSDGGKDYYNSGVISGSEQGIAFFDEDTCAYGSYVEERFCIGGEPRVEKYFCANGCDAGACVKEMVTAGFSTGSYADRYIAREYKITTSTSKIYTPFGDVRISIPDISITEVPTVTEVSICSDSDGGRDSSVKGTTTNMRRTDLTTWDDICLKDRQQALPGQENVLFEGYCSADGFGDIQNIACVNGCANGVCLKEPEILSCATLEETKFSYFDGCSDARYEAVCFNKYTGVYQGCVDATGEYCTFSNVNADENVACAVSGEPSCFDTDGGDEAFVFGEIVGDLVSGPIGDDICLDQFTLRELFCNADNKGEPKIIDCADGCKNGACIRVSSGGGGGGSGVVQYDELIERDIGFLVYDRSRRLDHCEVELPRDTTCDDYAADYEGQYQAFVDIHNTPFTNQEFIDAIKDEASQDTSVTWEQINAEANNVYLATVKEEPFGVIWYTGNAIVAVLVDPGEDNRYLEDLFEAYIEKYPSDLVFVQEEPVTVGCKDTDGGIEPFVFGELKGELVSGPINYDTCLGETTLRELFCNADNKGEPRLIECKYGCDKGVCLDTPVPEQPTIIQPGVACKDGCVYFNRCLPYGIRVDGMYCDISGNLESQKGSVLQCENNFECQSNFCLDARCTSKGFFQKIMDLLGRFI